MQLNNIGLDILENSYIFILIYFITSENSLIIEFIAKRYIVKDNE